MPTERNAVRHGVALNYDYFDLPSDIGTSGPENRLRFPRWPGVFFRPLGIIRPARGGQFRAEYRLLRQGNHHRRVLFHYSKQRLVVGQAGVAFLSVKSPT